MNYPEPTTKAVHLRAFDPDQLLHAVNGAQFEHFVLGKSRCEARLSHWSCGDLTVDIGNYSFPLRAVGPFPSKKICLGYMRGVRDMVWINGFRVSCQTMEIYPEGVELNYRANAAAEWVAVAFEEEALQRAARARLGRELDVPLRHVRSFIAPPDGRAMLDRLIRRLWNHPVSGAAMVEPILGAVAEIFDSILQDSPRRTRPNWLKRQAMLNRADKFLLTRNSDAPFDLATLAEAAGAHPRTLEREFVHAYGMPPIAWNRCLALHKVRSALLRGEGRKLTLASIAQRHGFRHMGRFSGYYHDLFGERPSHTLRRRQENGAFP